MRRRTITSIRAWHRSLATARTICDGEMVPTVLNYWGRAARRLPPPRCVYRLRDERANREWAAFSARLAALPPPPPLPEGKVHGFSNGTEYDLWTSRNCDGCALAGDPAERGSSRCPMFEMIHDAGASDGLFDEGLARRMGYLDAAPGEINTCPEREEPGQKEREAALARERAALAAWNAWAGREG